MNKEIKDIGMLELNESHIKFLESLIENLKNNEAFIKDMDIKDMGKYIVNDDPQINKDLFKVSFFIKYLNRE